jgi:hypothetical protein
MRKFILTLVFIFAFGTVASAQVKTTPKNEKPKVVEFTVNEDDAQALSNLVKLINSNQGQVKDVQLRLAEAQNWLAQFELALSKYKELFYKSVIDRKYDVGECTPSEDGKKITCPEKIK